MTDYSLPKKLTIQEIARLSGLSPATVDRVLNQRPGVKAATRERVAQVLAQSQAARQRLSDSPLQQVALVVEAGSGFIGLVEEALDAVRQRWPWLTFSFDRVLSSQRDPRTFCQLIRTRSHEADALILVSREEAMVSSTVREVAAAGRTVVCLSTDVNGSAGLVGVDEVAAGANAAFLMGNMLNARAQQNELLLVASSTYRCQEEREMGFRRVMRSEFPALQIREKIFSNDETDDSYTLMKRYLAQHPQTGGIYNTAGGNPGIARAIAECGLAQKIFFIGHELNGETRQLLEQEAMDIVFHHDAERELEACIQLILNSSGSVKEQRVTLPSLIYTKYSIS